MDWAACYWSGFLLDLFVPLWAPCQDGLELAGRWMISNFASYESLPGWAGGLVLRERGSARPLWQELLASLKPLIAAASGLPSSAGPRRALDQYGNQKFVNWLHRWKAGKDKSSSRFFCLCLTVCFLWGQKSSERLKQSRTDDGKKTQMLYRFSLSPRVRLDDRCVRYRESSVCVPPICTFQLWGGFLKRQKSFLKLSFLNLKEVCCHQNSRRADLNTLCTT